MSESKEPILPQHPPPPPPPPDAAPEDDDETSDSDEAELPSTLPGRRSSPPHAPSQRGSGRTQIRRHTPEEGTPMIIDRMPSRPRDALSGIAGSVVSTYEICR